jgi:hypothetical protein
MIGSLPALPAWRLDLPSRLSDREFWHIVQTFSEPGGFFNSDNLVSNEDTFQQVIPELTRTVSPGGVYVGVGPDQNFTYIEAIEPALWFITDVRRGNLQVHLMYKALVELSADRAEFLSRLFGRPRPRGLGAGSSLAELFAAFRSAAPDERLYQATLRAVLDRLTVHHGFRLQDGDAAGIEYALSSFFTAGPDLTFVSNGGGRRNVYPSFEALQRATDRTGVSRGYLATEAVFGRLKAHQDRNLIVPLVGNFAGTRALAAVAGYVRERGGVVTAFYTSNVEQYLFQDGLWGQFQRNVAQMPIDRTSTFIRSCFNTCSSPGGSRAVTLLDSVPGLLADAEAGRIRTYWDVLTHSMGGGSR